MADEDPLSKYNINEKKFVVVMVSHKKPAEISKYFSFVKTYCCLKVTKPKVTPAAAAAAPTPPQAVETDKKEGSEKQESKEETKTPVEEAPVPEASAAEPEAASVEEVSVSALASSDSLESQMVTGDDFERVVSNIMDMMGHPRDEVRLPKVKVFLVSND